jgi:hypothetical protein
MKGGVMDTQKKHGRRRPVGVVKFPGLFRSCLFAAALVIIFPATALSQTAARLDAVLEAERVSFAQAALVVLPAAGLLSPEASPAEAFARAREFFPGGADMDGPLSLGELSHLVMRSFGLSGGFMYAAFPGPRYAYRALAWLRLLPPGADPGRTVSGEELLYITGRALSHRGEGDAPGGEGFDAP